MAIKAVQVIAGPGPGIPTRQAWSVQFKGATGDDIVNIWNATMARFSKGGGQPQADNGSLSREGSVLMLRFKEPVTQSEAADTLSKLTSSKYLGSAYKILSLKTDALQVLNWKFTQVKAHAEHAEFPPAGCKCGACVPVQAELPAAPDPTTVADAAPPAAPAAPKADNFKGDFKPTELKPATEQMAKLTPLERELAQFAKLETAKKVLDERLTRVTQKLDTK